MQKKALCALALAPTMMALSVGAALPAHADQHRHGNDYPESQGWQEVDDTIVLKKGEACSKKVILHYTSHERTLVKGEDGYEPVLADDDFTPEAGDDFIIETGEDGRFSLYSPKTDRKVRRPASGDFYQKVTRDGEDLRIIAVGPNVYFGPSVNGIVWADGVQTLRVDDFAGEQGGTVENLQIEYGYAQQLCYRLGLKPVQQ